ncbi:hypothetical protein IV102_10790 [bacterium]|nr:hypothetical protein [bacterium]
MLRKRGMALITVLGLTTLLLLLGLTFLEYIEADYRFAAQQDRRQQAYNLALSGLEYQRQRTDLLHPDSGGPMQLSRALPSSSLTHFFEVTVEPSGRILSRGIVRNSFRELAQHQLIVEPGSSLPEAHSLP